MVADLTAEILRESGFVMSDSYEGSDSRTIRIAAAKQLPEVLNQHYLKGEVARPYARLGEMIQGIAKHAEDSDQTLKVTWHAAADLVKAHIDHKEAAPQALEDECLKIAHQYFSISKQEETIAKYKAQLLFEHGIVR